MAASIGGNNIPSQPTVTPAPLQPNQGPATAGPIPPTQGQGMNIPPAPPAVDPLSQLGAASRLTQRHARRLSAGSGGETLHQIVKGFKEILEANGNLENIRQITLDKHSNTLDVSSIVICQKIELAGVPVVAAHVLMIEATAGKLTPITQNYQGNIVEIPIVVGDLYNDSFWHHVEIQVKNAYGIKDLRVYEAGASVVHGELDAANQGALQQKLSLAIEATDRVLLPVAGADSPFSVTELLSEGRVQSRVVFNPEPLFTSDGLPIRSDLNLALTFTQNGNQNYQYGQFDPSERAVEIVATDNYINLMYNGNPQMQMMNPMMGMMQPPVYQAALVTTAVNSTIGQFDLPVFLLGMLLNLTLTRGMEWVNVFKPRMGAMQPNLRDIGAIGYENPHLVQQVDPQHPRGARIDTMSTAFDSTQLFSLIQRAIQPSLLYQLLVRERGEDSWLSSIFLAAASAVPEVSLAAQNSIIAAANQLTNGQFSMYFTGCPIVIENQNRVHLGYYVSNHTNERRDIMDIDYLAVMSVLGEHDVSLAGRFDATLQDYQPLPLRMAERLRIISGIVGDFKHKGYGRIVTFTPTFLTALAQAAHAAGLVINSAPQYLDGVGVQRGNPLLASMGMAPAMMMGMGLFQNQGWGPNNMMYPGQQMRYGGIYGR